MTSVYIILGAKGSGRHEILRDILTNGFDAKEEVRVYHTPEFQKGELADLPINVEIMPWGLENGNLSITTPETAPHTVFIVTDGRQNPVDQIEVLAAVVRRMGWQVARVMTVIHCALLEQNPSLADWFKACIHFSDVALLNRRENVPNAWMKKFTDGYKEACNPCAFELVKKGKVENPARILLPESRRLSMIFDETDPLDDMEFDEDNLPDEPFDLTAKPDSYFERTQSGARCIQIPDIATFISS